MVVDILNMMKTKLFVIFSAYLSPALLLGLWSPANTMKLSAGFLWLLAFPILPKVISRLSSGSKGKPGKKPA
jgi:hypothetical protein